VGRLTPGWQPGVNAPMLTLLTVILAQAVPVGRLARAEIWFDARASVADFQGRTTVATGTLEWVEVRWRDIDTQNGTRNRHMLKTVDDEHFPVIRFDFTGATADTGQVRLKGTLTLHGVSRPVEWPAVIRGDADSVSVAADFPVDMRDYGIKPPVKFVIARMGAVVMVHVRLGFVRGRAL
jgi:polyisoprenoid-binding protein YceI